MGGVFTAALGRSAESPLGTVVACEQPGQPRDAPESAQILPATMLSAGVLGRPAARTTVAGAVRKEGSSKEKTTADEEVLAVLREEERPETVSVPPKQELAVEPVRTVSAGAGGPAFTIPDFDVRAELTASATEGTVDPKERGMHVPASAISGDGISGSATSGGGTELSAAPVGTFPMITPTAPSGPPAAHSGSATGHGMGPMMPPMMMGGMRGGAGGQDGERFAEVPVTPDAEVWDPLRATGAVLGRPEPEPSETPEPCTEQEIDAVRQAAIDEILGKKG
jgi:hypothetical protein